MSRRSLRPQLNQIRGWVRQGRTDAWIAHQLEVTVQQIQSFKRENELEADGGERHRGVRGGRPPRRGRRRHRRRARGRGGPPRRGGGQARRGGRRSAPPTRTPSPSEGRRAKRAPRKRRRAAAAAAPAAATDAAGPLEGTFDHGEEGYGLWLDPAVEDDPDLRRALGRPPARRGDDRGGPDRHPSRQWRRRRRRLSSRACARTGGRCSSATPPRAEPFAARPGASSPPRIPRSGTSTCWSSRTRPRPRAGALTAEAERLQAPAGLRHRKVEVHSGGSRARRRLPGGGLERRARGRDAAPCRRRPAAATRPQRCARSSSQPSAA